MSDKDGTGGNGFQKLRLWIKTKLIPETPEAISSCEWSCPKFQCLHGTWDTCKHRLGDIDRNRF